MDGLIVKGSRDSDMAAQLSSASIAPLTNAEPPVCPTRCKFLHLEITCPNLDYIVCLYLQSPLHFLVFLVSEACTLTHAYSVQLDLLSVQLAESVPPPLVGSTENTARNARQEEYGANSPRSDGKRCKQPLKLGLNVDSSQREVES
jgi:hypothetical protein